MTPLQLLQQIKFTGPNEAGEYWLHFKEGELGSGCFIQPHCLHGLAMLIEQWEANRREIINREAE